MNYIGAGSGGEIYSIIGKTEESSLCSGDCNIENERKESHVEDKGTSAKTGKQKGAVSRKGNSGR